MQLLARLSFDRVRIIFEMIHMLLEPGILGLKLLDLGCQHPIFAALLRVRGNSILPKDRVVAEHQRHRDRDAACHAPSHGVHRARGTLHRV